MRSPYAEAVEWIEMHRGTGSAIGLGKLILSLWNDTCCFAFSECVRDVDEDRMALALQMVTHFAAHGEDAELRRAGERLCGLFPHLWEAGQAGSAAKRRALSGRV